MRSNQQLEFTSCTSTLGVVSGLCSAFAFTMMGLFVHWGAARFPSSELVALRALINLLCLTPFVAKNVQLLFSVQAKPVWMRSLAGFLSVICYFWTLKKGTVANAVVLSDFAPVFVVLISWKFLKENIVRAQAIGILIVLLGVALLRFPHISSSISLEFLLIGSSGAFCGGLAYVSLKQATSAYPPNLVIWAFSLVTLIGACLILRNDLIFPKLLDIPLLLGLGLFGLLGQISLTYSYVFLPASVASTLALSGLIWAVILQFLFDAIMPSNVEILSYLIIISGLFLVQRAARKRA